MVYGERRNGWASAAVPLFEWDGEPGPLTRWKAKWPNMRFRKAEALIRKTLAGVGSAESERLTGRAALEEAARRLHLGPDQVCGLSGRRRLTQAEALACLWPSQLAAINPSFALLVPDPANDGSLEDEDQRGV